MEIIKNVFDSLHRYLIRNDFTGYEYDDLLASPFINFLTFNSLYLKIAAVQIAKRSFLNLRGLLGVKKLKSTKAFGFMVKGYLYHHLATGEDKYLEFVESALSWLVENKSAGYSGFCWGNDFDFASRAGIFPRGLPTIVWTSHIQEAFDLAHDVLNNDKYKELVISTANFIENDLQKIRDSSGICFAYAPGIVKPIHNSNLLGAAALLRAWKYTKNKKHLELAKQSINWSISRINNDGSWFYGDENMLHWIDNYHTAYNLDSLCKAYEIAGKDLVDPEIIKKTYHYWKTHLFTEDFKPKFYHNRLYPLDIQAAAQAIESFSRYSQYEPEALSIAQKVADWTINNTLKKNGSFRYRIYKYWKNNLEPIHWGQGAMLSALGYLLFYTYSKTNSKEHTNG
jgi:uncharacterized protein YyaL (SSP411 family)